MSFLSVPLKKSYEVEVGQPVQRWIASTYSNADKPEDSRASSELQKLRNNAVCRPLDRNESSLEVIYRYHDQLTAIESKLPITLSQIIIPFKWKDAFDKGTLFSKSSLTLSSGGYEKACVLFNTAALQSQVAATQALDSDSDLKLCAKMFQLSSGIFLHLKDNVMTMVGQEATPDLMPDVLAALSALMLSQAQEAIYLKAARDKLKPQTVAKIANQAADLYADALRQMNREPLRSLWDRDWMGTVASKNGGFLALAHYYQSLVSKEEKDVGPELAHLTKAHDLMSAANCAQLFPDDVPKVRKAYESAKKDNDFIYHERIPDVKTLEAIGKAALAKPTHVHGPMSQNFRDLFAHLVPVAVQQALAAYDTRRSAILNTETARMREATTLMNGILASLNLPAAVEDVCNAEVLPASLKSKAGAVRNAGGIQKIKQQIEELPALFNRNKEMLDETCRLLTEEKQSDDNLRAQFKEKWTRLPSERLTEPLYVEIGKYRSILNTAAGADDVVRQKFATHQRGLELLSKPEAALISAIPTLVAGGSGGNTPAVVKLKSLLTRTDAIIAERVSIEEDLKASGTSADMSTTFLKALAESGALNEEHISTSKLNDIYAPVRERISRSIHEQEQLMKEIQEANVDFSRQKGAGGNEREQFLRQLAAAADAQKELCEHLKEGAKFYNDLTPLILRLQQKVTDYDFARKTEKDELMLDLQKNIVNSSANSETTAAGKSAPPRPPPPSAPTATSTTNQPVVAPGSAPPMVNTAAQQAMPPMYQQQQQPYLGYNPGLPQVPITGAAQPTPQHQPQQQPYAGYNTWPGPGGPMAYGQQPPPYQPYQQQPSMPYPTYVPNMVMPPAGYTGYQQGYPPPQQQPYQTPYPSQQPQWR